MGPYSVSFSHTEMREYGSRRALAVYFHCEQVGTLNDMDDFQRHFFTAFKVKDASGKSHSGLPIVAQAFAHMQGNSLRSLEPRDEQMSAREYAMELDSARDGPNVRDWVAVFAVPVGAQGFKLYVRNPDRRGGQPDEAVIDLGR